jgi:hypothetical protein
MMKQLFTNGHAEQRTLVAAQKWQSPVCSDIATPAYKLGQLNSGFVGGVLDK